jgi:hypothetical protein
VRNPLIAEIRRIRTKMYREWLSNPNRDYIAESQEMRRKVCDVVIDAEGKTHYITNRQKMYDVFIAPRLAEEAARAKRRRKRRRA